MHPLLRQAADRQWGLFTATDARRAGYGHDEIRSACSTGAWVRLRRGVYTTAERLTELGGRRHSVDCLATLLSLDRPTTALSHGSAARILGLPVWTGLRPIVRLTDPTQWRSGRLFRMNRAPLGPGHVMWRGPFQVTSVARTLVDCGREWALEDAVVAMDAALLGDRTTTRELLAVASGMPCWPGVQRARRAIELADGRAESPLETRGRLRLVGSELRPSALQVEIRSSGRLVAVVDAWFEEAAVAVEFDGRVKYTEPWRERSPGQVLWDEKRREDDLRTLDIRVVRITEGDLGSGWATVERRLAGLLTTPGPVPRLFTATPRDRGRRRSA